MTTLREAAQQALEALEAFLSDELRPHEAAKISAALRAALAQQAEPLNLRDPAVQKRLVTQWGYVPAAQAEPAQEQAEPLTIERLRYALVASRLIPPEAVEDPDEYDDGVTLHRIEALHRRLT